MTLIPGFKLSLLICMLAIGSSNFGFSNEPSFAQEKIAGRWQAHLNCPGGELRFDLELANDKDKDKWSGFLINGDERIEIPSVLVKDNSVTLEIDHYDSRLELVFESQNKKLTGTWTKRRGLNKWVKMEFSAVRAGEASKAELADPDKFLGRWQVEFDKSEDAAVAVFEKAKDSNEVRGTFLTTTGDYRFLSGQVVDGKLALSCFDGAHAFLFDASLEGGDEARTLKGNFWSSKNWHETWSAKKDPNAKLPDAFEQTKATEAAKQLGQLSFPDLDGKLMKLNDPKFAGKARIIYVFGSWCPNCHDAAKYFSELETKYGDKGLSILGLAFELTGEFERDAAQVRKYLKRHGSKYPVLVAGVNDKADATKRLTILDKVRSYPTTIFLDSEGKVVAVHTGFTGPATGDAYVELRAKFEKLIEELLGT